MNTIGVARSPRLVLFGHGQRAALAGLIRTLGKRAFISTDNRWAIDPLLRGMAEDLRAQDIAVDVYEDTVAELPMKCIDDAAQRARRFEPDVIVGVGGGSCIDLAKIVSLCLSHPGPLSTYYGEFKIPGPILPVIAIPTTAGTGSETTPVAVIADPEREMKVGISSPYLIPDIAVCDPELTLTCPPRLTAIVGADALTHAIEAFTAIQREPEPQSALQRVFIGKNVFSDAQAVTAIKALAQYLPDAVADSGDRKAREQVMLGAFSAGQAFGVAGTAAAHAIQYPIGAITHTPHGAGVAALMPYVLAFNLPFRTREIAEIGDLVGANPVGTEEARAVQAVAAVADLLQRIGIPQNLAELGLPADRIDWVAENSMAAARLVNNNPRPLDRQAMLAIVSAAHAGDRARLYS